MENKNKVQALKPAPWWKRLLSFIIDSAILFVILVLFISGLYGEELALLLSSINEKGAVELIKESHISFPIDISNMPINEQNMAYWVYLVQSKYSQSIFILSQIISIFYFGLFWWSTGQTMGGKALKIKVIAPLKDRVPLPSVIARVIALKIVEIAWGIPLLIITNPILKQRVHDSISNTVVVEEISDEEEEQIAKVKEMEEISKI